MSVSWEGWFSHPSALWRMLGHGDQAHVRAEKTDTNNTLLKSELENLLAGIDHWTRQVGLVYGS